MKTSVIIPAYNEEKSIKKTINSLKKLRDIDEIIVIDDGSKDRTYFFAKECDVRVIKFYKNQGKGRALREGIQYCTGDIIVFLDADVGESAVEVEKIIVPVKNNLCDVAIARFGKAKKKGGFGLVKFISRKGVKWLTGQYVESVLSGQRVFKAEVLKSISIGEGYGAEVKMTIDIIRKGYRILQCDVNMQHRETGRDFQGFIHRGIQMYQIVKVFLNEIRSLRKET